MMDTDMAPSRRSSMVSDADVAAVHAAAESRPTSSQGAYSPRAAASRASRRLSRPATGVKSADQASSSTSPPSGSSTKRGSTERPTTSRRDSDMPPTWGSSDRRPSGVPWEPTEDPDQAPRKIRRLSASEGWPSRHRAQSHSMSPEPSRAQSPHEGPDRDRLRRESHGDQDLESGEGHYTWQSSRSLGGSGAMSIASMSKGSVATTRPEGMVGADDSEVEHSRASPPTSIRLPSVSSFHQPDTYRSHHKAIPGSPPHYDTGGDRRPPLAPFPGSARAVRAVSMSPSQSNMSHASVHPSLIGLPGAGGGPGSKQQPSFVMKLYSMLEDRAIEDMMAWNQAGDLFSVASPSEFSKHVLPNYFKHSNWQSFVRQLNMYGFHKVNHNHTYPHGGGEDPQIWEFRHPNFRRGQLHLLSDIKRKSSRPGKYTGTGGRGTDDGGDGRTAQDRSSGSPSPSVSSRQMGPDDRISSGPSSVIHQSSGPEHRSRAFSDVRAAYGREYGSISGMSGVEVSGVPSASSMARSMRSSGGSELLDARGLPAHGHPPGIAGASMDSPSASLRLDDLSDRLDAVIRHSNYLEGQLRSVSEQLFSTQQTESNLRIHTLRMLNRLMNVCASSASVDGREGYETRRGMLEACQAEMAELQAFLQLEPGLISPSLAPTTMRGGEREQYLPADSRMDPPPRGARPPHPSSHPYGHPPPIRPYDYPSMSGHSAAPPSGPPRSLGGPPLLNKSPRSSATPGSSTWPRRH